jgi:hypothetical protein
MMMLMYVAVAIAFLILVILAVREGQPADPEEASNERNYAPNLGSGRWLDLSERIFDPSDVRWLEKDLAFPKLAKGLATARKRLAIRWLKALQSSFDEVVRTREGPPSKTPEANSPTARQMLWLTLRFNLLLWYALFVVWVFGPYHRLIPSFSWVPFQQGSERSFRRAAMADNRTSR